MKPLWLACFSLFFACFLLSACSASPQGVERAEGQLGIDLEAIASISVFTADGQEVPLDHAIFMERISRQHGEFHASDQPMKPEEVRFTLVAYRQNGSPLVMEVGAQASRFGETTFRGVGAEEFYRQIRELTGKSLLRRNLHAVEAKAMDLARSVTLQASQVMALEQWLRTAEYHPDQESHPYPLYPDYRLELDYGDRVVEATVMTPSLLAVNIGDERLYFHVSGELFSRLTEWLPLYAAHPTELDVLFKTTEMHLIPGKAKNVKERRWKMEQSEAQAVLHHLVRILRTGEVTTDNKNVLAAEPQYTLIFYHQGKAYPVSMHPHQFVLQDTVYLHRQADKQILQLLERLGK